MNAHDQALLYSLLHCGHTGDIDHYARISSGAQRGVLELGSGAGRATIPLARTGLQVVGMEADEHMLALAHEAEQREDDAVQSRIRWRQGDMADYTLDTLFDRILLPYNTLLCLLSADAVARCFACARRHLAAGGLLAFDIYHADRMHAGWGVTDSPDDSHGDAPPDEDEDEDEAIVSICHADQIFDVFERSDWDPARQRLDTAYRFAPRDGGTVYTQHIPQRYLLTGELEQLLADSGFHILRHSGGFLGEPADAQADHHVIVATPA
jgi:SAM-dependent methyltransferase